MTPAAPETSPRTLQLQRQEVRPQHRVHPRLVAVALGAEPRRHRVEAQRQAALRRRRRGIRISKALFRQKEEYEMDA